MSHFTGLVILTPQYLKKHDLEDSLARYDEQKSVPEYKHSMVSDSEKVRCLDYYCHMDSKENLYCFYKAFYKHMVGKLIRSNDKAKAFVYEHEEEYTEFFKEAKPEVFAKFDAIYEENGEDWNSNRWRKDENGEWACYSTYNPDSKWDWYDNNGRWSNYILTKRGEHVNECMFHEIDLETPIIQDNRCFSYDNPPFAVVIDGEWHEKGCMGWFGMTSNEKPDKTWEAEFKQLLTNIDPDSEVYNIDFHI